MVIWVSPAAMVGPAPGRSLDVVYGDDTVAQRRFWGSVTFWAQNLRPQHSLVEVQLAVEFAHRVRIRGQVDHGVDALELLVDAVGQPAPAPHVDLVDGSTVVLDHGEELV